MGGGGGKPPGGDGTGGTGCEGADCEGPYPDRAAATRASRAASDTGHAALCRP